MIYVYAFVLFAANAASAANGYPQPLQFVVSMLVVMLCVEAVQVKRRARRDAELMCDVAESANAHADVAYRLSEAALHQASTHVSVAMFANASVAELNAESAVVPEFAAVMADGDAIAAYRRGMAMQAARARRYARNG